jgi:hypothetical protein
MGNDNVANTPISPLRQLCNRAKVGDEAMALFTDNYSTKEFISLLMQKELFRDAFRLVAYLLPKRESIGWGCLCLRHALATDNNKPLPDVQLAVERWVTAPQEENRWAAKQLADKEKAKTASGLLASAVFYAGPSIAAPQSKPVPPPEHLTAEFVANAVFIAGVASKPEKAKEKYDVFMQKAFALIARMQQPPQA